MPCRIQMKRTKGWRLPEGAIVVARPTLFGNPWRPSDGTAWNIPPDERQAWAVRMYERELAHFGLLNDYSERAPRQYDLIAESVHDAGSMREYARRVLRGHDLACYCPLDLACHADLLLEICAQ